MHISQTNWVLKQLHLASKRNELLLWKLWNFWRFGEAVRPVATLKPLLLLTAFKTRFWTGLEGVGILFSSWAAVLFDAGESRAAAARLKLRSKLCELLICLAIAAADDELWGIELTSVFGVVDVVVWLVTRFCCCWSCVFVSIRWDEVDFFELLLILIRFFFVSALGVAAAGFLFNFSYTNMFESLVDFS